MIDLQSIRKMAKATENGKHYISPMKNKSEGGVAVRVTIA